MYKHGACVWIKLNSHLLSAFASWSMRILMLADTIVVHRYRFEWGHPLNWASFTFSSSLFNVFLFHYCICCLFCVAHHRLLKWACSYIHETVPKIHSAHHYLDGKMQESTEKEMERFVNLNSRTQNARCYSKKGEQFENGAKEEKKKKWKREIRQHFEAIGKYTANGNWNYRN